MTSVSDTDTRTDYILGSGYNPVPISCVVF